jgi:hypothetical protein
MNERKSKASSGAIFSGMASVEEIGKKESDKLEKE